MTKTEQKILDIVKNNGFYTMVVDFYNIDLEPKTNKRLYKALVSLEESGLVSVERKYYGKNRPDFFSPQIATFGYKLKEPKYIVKQSTQFSDVFEVIENNTLIVYQGEESLARDYVKRLNQAS